jgi:hypothetical protein
LNALQGDNETKDFVVEPMVEKVVENVDTMVLVVVVLVNVGYIVEVAET